MSRVVTMALPPVVYDTVKHVILGINGLKMRAQPTLNDHQVPLLFRERFLLAGYRVPYKSWWYYLRSLINIHNESGNVLSHLLAFFIFAYKIYAIGTQVDYVNDPLSPAILGFAMGTLLYAVCSAFAHLFQSKSEYWHYLCFQIDYIGIGMNGFGNATLLYYLTGSASFYKYCSSFYMAVNAMFAILVCVSFSVAKLRYARPYPVHRKLLQFVACGAHVIYGSTPFFWKLYECMSTGSYCQGYIAVHLYIAFWFAMSSFFFASSIPERFMPGKCDIFAHGHQIFHVTMIYTSLLQYEAAVDELKIRPAELVTLAEPRLWTIFGLAAVVVIVDVIYIILTHSVRRGKVFDDAVHWKNCNIPISSRPKIE